MPEEGKLRLLDFKNEQESPILDIEREQVADVVIRSGEFSVGPLPDGRYKLELCAPGFQTLVGILVVDHKQDSQPLELITELDW